ncbi:hypothetical protein PMAYCL1PPCAC_19313, partial [Pristionchus mayeri]
SPPNDWDSPHSSSYLYILALYLLIRRNKKSICEKDSKCTNGGKESAVDLKRGEDRVTSLPYLCLIAICKHLIYRDSTFTTCQE